VVIDFASSPRLRVTPRRAAVHGRTLLILCLAGLVPAAVLIATSLGPSATGPAETFVILLEPVRPVLEALGIAPSAPSAAAISLVWSIRLPRVLLALVVGAGLGAAGLVMQAVFRNPLADPGVTGVSSGAAVVAVILIVTGLATRSPCRWAPSSVRSPPCSWCSSSRACAAGQGAPCCWSGSR
jgi:iron complex transport system permease protein